MIVITSGDRYIDIDAYASMIVYKEYLKAKGIECVAISNSILNDSIPSSILNMDYKLDNYIPSKNDNFIILDVSEPTMLDKSVNNKNVIEIIDHHFGYEEYWNSLLGEKAQIEQVGAVATLIYEKVLNNHLENIISIDLAKILLAAILDNTLNLKARITTSRDINAYNKLMLLIADSHYPSNYYEEIEGKIKENVIKALENETNIYNISKIIPKYFSQLVVFDKSILLDDLEAICLNLNKLYDKYIINLVCLSEGKSYIITTSNDIKRDIELLLDANFKDNVMELKDIWLRKEIIKKAKGLIDKNYNI